MSRFHRGHNLTSEPLPMWDWDRIPLYRAMGSDPTSLHCLADGSSCLGSGMNGTRREALFGSENGEPLGAEGSWGALRTPELLRDPP